MICKSIFKYDVWAIQKYFVMEGLRAPTIRIEVHPNGSNEFLQRIIKTITILIILIFRFEFFTVLDNGLHVGLCPLGKLNDKRNERLPDVCQSVFHFGRCDRIDLAIDQSVGFERF